MIAATETGLRDRLSRLVEGYVIETSTVLAPADPEPEPEIDQRSFRLGFNSGARSGLLRAVADIRDAAAS